MAKKQYDEDEEEDEYDEDELDEEEEEEDEEEEKQKPKKKKVKPKKKNEDMNWQHFKQEEFVGLRNVETDEIISAQEAMRRILCFSEEAAKNTR